MRKITIEEGKAYRVDGYKGTYGEIDRNGDYVLLESDIYGDEAPCLIVKTEPFVEERKFKKTKTGEKFVADVIVGFVLETYDNLTDELVANDLI